MRIIFWIINVLNFIGCFFAKIIIRLNKKIFKKKEPKTVVEVSNSTFKKPDVKKMAEYNDHIIRGEES